MTFSNKCKICRSNKADEIEFCRFYLNWSYSTLIDLYENDIDNLNNYNLSNHYNNHANRERISFWQNLRQSIGIYKPTVAEQNMLFIKMKKERGD